MNLLKLCLSFCFFLGRVWENGDGLNEFQNLNYFFYSWLVGGYMRGVNEGEFDDGEYFIFWIW